jgi:hypothetical protein
VPLLQILEVIYMDDAAPVDCGKMAVCVAPVAGFFFRINTRPWPVPVALAKADHPFLKIDSNLECSPPLDLDDYVIEQFLNSNGGQPLGCVHQKHLADIWKAVQSNG